MGGRWGDGPVMPEPQGTVPFAEESVPLGRKDESVYAASPLGKVPFVRVPQGTLCESQVICDWLEAAYPQPALMPADPFEAAKARELITFIELHLELAPQARLLARTRLLRHGESLIDDVCELLVR